MIAALSLQIHDYEPDLYLVDSERLDMADLRELRSLLASFFTPRLEP